MFVWQPRFDKKRSTLSGFYLILMLPQLSEDIPPGEEPLRARVIKTEMKVNPIGPITGKWVSDGNHYPLKGILGNNGPLVVTGLTYQRGVPLPKILAEVFDQGMKNLYHRDWQAEFAAYGRSLYNRQLNGQDHACYRCGKSAAQGDPCPACVSSLESGLHVEGMKPPAITIRPVGIETGEKVMYHE